MKTLEYVSNESKGLLINEIGILSVLLHNDPVLLNLIGYLSLSEHLMFLDPFMFHIKGSSSIKSIERFVGSRPDPTCLCGYGSQRYTSTSPTYAMFASLLKV